jgi:hypothetical protein
MLDGHGHAARDPKSLAGGGLGAGLDLLGVTGNRDLDFGGAIAHSIHNTKA